MTLYELAILRARLIRLVKHELAVLDPTDTDRAEQLTRIVRNIRFGAR